MPLKPGIYPELSNKDYHADSALGSSMMSLLAKSPAHLKAYMDNPPTPTDDMVLGSGFDCKLTQPDLFDSQFVIWPKGYHRKEAKIREAEEAGLEWFKEANLPIIDAMVKVFRNHKIASTLLSEGESQVSYFWKHPKYGFVCKCRPDYLRYEIQIDLKSAKDASPEGFAKSIANYGYHRQSSHYRTGLAACHISVDDTVLIAQEKKPPYAIGIYRLSEEDLYLGYEQNKLIYKKYEKCLSTDKWEGYSPNIENISLPAWYVRKALI